jgi:hypothetical protein
MHVAEGPQLLDLVVGQIAVALNTVVCLVRLEIKINVMKMAFDPPLLQNPVAKVNLLALLTFQNRFLKGGFLFFLLLILF